MKARREDWLACGAGMWYTGGMTDQTKNTISYLVGFRLGSQVLPQMLPGVQGEDLSGEALMRGICAALAGESPAAEVISQDLDKHQREFMAALSERANAKGRANAEAGKKYLAENAKREGVVTTPSGLQYEVIVPGGTETYDPAVHGENPKAEVMYTGTLIDGTVFDKSKQPVSFGLKQVIPGFTEALKLMPIGATWRVTIPSELAYGANGPGAIRPHSTLIFEMQLLSLK